MSMHLYAFGSICRGEIDKSSDVDLLACLSDSRSGIDPRKFSIYSHQRIQDLWTEGNPFAWHLHLESRLLFSSNGEDFISCLGKPALYSKMIEDCEKFRALFMEALGSLEARNNISTFDVSCMFLATRNFATCYSLGIGKPVFSRYSPLIIEKSLQMPEADFDIYVRARVLSTRGYGERLSSADITRTRKSARFIVDWMHEIADCYLLPEIRYERV